MSHNNRVSTISKARQDEHLYQLLEQCVYKDISEQEFLNAVTIKQQDDFLEKAHSIEHDTSLSAEELVLQLQRYDMELSEL